MGRREGKVGLVGTARKATCAIVSSQRPIAWVIQRPIAWVIIKKGDATAHSAGHDVRTGVNAASLSLASWPDSLYYLYWPSKKGSSSKKVTD